MNFNLDGVVYLAFGFFLTLPLAVWKVVDIVIWIFNHVSVSWTG